MIVQSLRDCRILIVEDEYYLAEELALGLADAGAQVIGPVADIYGARALLDGQSPPDGAVLDVNLGGELVFALADELLGQGVPLIFTTGYDPSTLPERFAHVPTCEKPINAAGIAAAIRAAIHVQVAAG